MTTMFLNDHNVVDHAYIDEQGRILGGSFAPRWKVSGDVDPQEQVVVDFSKCKKQIKQIIDADDKTGFDHKLWITPTSKCSWTVCEETSWGIDRIVIRTPLVDMDIPRDRVRIISGLSFPAQEYSCGNAGEWMRKWVEKELRKIHGDHLSLECYNSEDFRTHPLDATPGLGQVTIPFRYTHGLKNSSSWGCRNPAHGHLSFIDIRFEATDRNDIVKKLRDKIKNELDGAVFAWQDNIILHTDEDTLIVQYDDLDGTRYHVEYQPGHHPVEVQTETTIENLVNFISDRYKNELSEMKAVDLYVSEGLNKGAYLQLR